MTFHGDLPYTTKQFTTDLTDVTLTTLWLLWSNKFRASLLKNYICDSVHGGPRRILGWMRGGDVGGGGGVGGDLQWWRHNMAACIDIGKHR